MSRTCYGKAVSANNYRWRDRATITLGGNVASDSTVNVPTIGQTLGHRSGLRSHPPESSTYATTKALSTGNFAVLTANRYVMKLECDYLAGVSYSGLNGGGNMAGAHHSIHWVGARRTNPITSWNYATGEATKGTSTSDNFMMDVTGNDDAATPSASVPGELCYMIKGTTATTADYSSKTLW